MGARKFVSNNYADIKGMIAIFTYGFPISTENFEKEGVELHTLSDYENLIEQASDTHYIKENQLQTLLEWRSNPQQWKP